MGQSRGENVDRWPARGIVVGIALLAWLGTSAVFLATAWDTPGIAVRGDDYWAMSRWFEEGGPFPYSHFGPGFPFLIYVLSSAGLDMFGVLVVQKLMLAATGYCIFAIGRLLSLPFRMCVAAGAVFAIAPLSQGISSTFFSETFYVLLICIATLLFLGARSPRRFPQWVPLLAAFAVLGLASLVRGNGLVLIAAYGLLGLFLFRPRHVLLSLVIAALPVLGWSSMNYQWYGHFKPTSSGDANIADSLVGPVKARLEGKPLPADHETWAGPDWQDEYANLFEVSAATRDMAIDYALAHPVPVVVGNIRGWFHSMLGPGRFDILTFAGEGASWLVLVSAALRAAFLVGMLAFIVLGAWRRYPVFATILAAVFVAHILPSGAAGFSRFGFPMDAFSVLALALALQHLLDRRRLRLRQPM